MSDAEPQVHASFVKSFLPGLVLGLVVGAVGGVLLTDLVFSRQPDLPRVSAEQITGPGTGGADQREGEPLPAETPAESEATDPAAEADSETATDDESATGTPSPDDEQP